MIEEREGVGWAEEKGIDPGERGREGKKEKTTKVISIGQIINGNLALTSMMLIASRAFSSPALFL